MKRKSVGLIITILVLFCFLISKKEVCDELIFSIQDLLHLIPSTKDFVFRGKIAVAGEVKERVDEYTINLYRIIVIDLESKEEIVLPFYGELYYTRLKDIAWSPDGKKIAFIGSTLSGGVFKEYIYIINASSYILKAMGNKTSQRDLEFLKIATPFIHLWDIQFSPDGKKIIFAATKDEQSVFPNPTYEIYLMNSDGTNITKLTQGYYPRWSPDGKKIVFERGDYHIYVINADGTNLTRLPTENLYPCSPNWSPDGKEIIFSAHPDPFSPALIIGVMSFNGSNLRWLTNAKIIEPGYRESSWDIRAVWIPGRNKIIFISNRDGYWAVYMINPDGTNLIQLTRNPNLNPKSLAHSPP